MSNSPENLISSAIVRKFCGKLLDGLKLDVAIVGGGPSALVAARDLASRGLKVAIFERKLAPGGGTWGGGMLFNEVVVQDEALPVLDFSPPLCSVSQFSVPAHSSVSNAIPLGRCSG